MPINTASAHKIEFNYNNSNSFEDGNGTTVESQTIGKNSSKKDVIIRYNVNTGDGLTIDEGNKVVIDLATGKGLDFYTGDNGKQQVGIKLADKSGLDFANDGGLKVNVKDNSGLINDENGLSIDTDYLKENIGDGSWTAQAGAESNKENQIKVDSKNNTLKFIGNENIDVTADEGAIKVSLKDNITLDGEKGRINFNPDNENNIISVEDNKSNSVFNIDQDGKISSDSDIIAYADDKKYSLAEISEIAVKYDKNPDGNVDKGSITLAGGVDPETGKKGTLITNLKDGLVSKGSSDAVNGSQLYDVQQKHTVVTVNGGTPAPELGEDKTEGEGTYSEDGNLQLKQTVTDGQTRYDVKLNDNISLGEGKITLNGAPETEDADLLNVDNTLVVGQDGTTTITADDAETMGTDTKVTVGTNGVTFEGLGNGTTFIDGQTIHAGGIDINGEETKGTITKLTNTDWDPNGTYTMGRAATEEQLQKASAASKTTISDGKNTNVTWEDKEDGHRDYKVNLNDNVTLGEGSSQITLNGKPEGDAALMSVGDKLVVEQDGTTTITADDAETMGTDTKVTVGTNGVTFEGLGNGTTFIDGQTIHAGGIDINGEETKGTITKLTNTDWDPNGTYTMGRAATEEQLQKASAASKTTISDGKNTNVTWEDKEDGHRDYKVNLNDNVYLGGNRTAQNSNIKLDGEKGNIQVGSNIALLGEDGRAIIGGVDISTTFDDIGKKSATITGLSNTTWDGSTNNITRAATEGQLQMVSDKVTAGWTATDDAGHKINVNPNTRPTLNFASGKNITVSANEDNGEVEVSLNDVVTLGDGEDAIKIDGTNGTLNIGSTFAVAEDGTVLSDGDVIADADGEKYSLSEVGKYAVRYDKTNDGTSTITLADGDDLSGTRIKNVADGVDPKDAVNVSQLEAVKETANAGWNAKAGGNTINVKPNETLNFEGDGNITVSATGGTSNELKFGLNDNITLGDKAGQKTSTSLTLYTDPTLKEVTRIGEDGNPETVKVTGYIPESYIDDQERVDNFISTHGGFMMYATNTSGEGVFGITTDGMVHAKDVISYMPNSDSTSKDKILKYSLNDIGDIVTQIAHGQYDKTGMEYTLISDFSSVEDKDKPFQAEDGNRTIGLAVRQDGAVVVGAIVNKEGKLAESGIRINDDTNAGGGKDTITGLSNTDWRPAAIRDSISTFGIENDDDSKAKIEKSKAATQGQLDAMYDTVVGYDINESKTDIDYSTITLKGTPYGSTKDGNGSHEGGTLITNVAYAVTDTDSDKYNGSAAVNVDLLKDTVADVTSQASNSDRYLTSGKLDGNTLSLTVSDLNGYNNVITIGDIASRSEVNNQIASINSQINDINTKIENIGTGTGGNNNTAITGGRVDETGNLVLEKNDGSKVEVGQLTDSAVSDVNFDKEKGTLTITNKDNYTGKESGTPITVEGIASKDDIEAVNDTIGATSKEDLKDKYKDTEYLKDENGETVETLADADIALDHAVQGLVTNDKYLNSRIDNVEKRLGDVEQRIDKVGAMAAAIANLRTMGFDPEAPTEIAVGVGQYKSETGLAIGVFHYPNQDFMLSASLSTSGDEVMGGIGATWRIGRKTAAEKAKDEEKRILAKAEEIKQAAKRAEVKAQADRHAKLLAEREAKGESIRPIENKVEQTQEQA